MVFASEFRFEDPESWVFPEGTSNLVRELEYSRSGLDSADRFMLYLWVYDAHVPTDGPAQALRSEVILGGTIPRKVPNSAPIVETFTLGRVSDLLELPSAALAERVDYAMAWLLGSASAQGGAVHPPFGSFG